MFTGTKSTQACDGKLLARSFADMASMFSSTTARKNTRPMCQPETRLIYLPDIRSLTRFQGWGRPKRKGSCHQPRMMLLLMVPATASYRQNAGRTRREVKAVPCCKCKLQTGLTCRGLCFWRHAGVKVKTGSTSQAPACKLREAGKHANVGFKPFKPL